jgi:arginine repressor
MAKPKYAKGRVSTEVNRIITKGLLRNQTYDDIRQELAEQGIDLSNSAISNRVRRMQKRAVFDIAEQVDIQQQIMEWVIGEAMDAWRASQEEHKVETTERIQKTGGNEGFTEAMKALVRREGREGNVAYLNAIIGASQQIARLRGLYAPQRQEVSGPGGGAIQIDTAVQAEAAERLELWRQEQRQKIEDYARSNLPLAPLIQDTSLHNTDE